MEKRVLLLMSIGVGFENGDIRFRREVCSFKCDGEINYFGNSRYCLGYRVEEKERNYRSDLCKNRKYPDNSEYTRA